LGPIIKDVDKLQRIQQRAIKMVRGWSTYYSFEAEGAELVQPKKRWLQGEVSVGSSC